MNKVVANADVAIRDLQDGAVIMCGGFGLSGIPENLLSAIVRQDQFAEGFLQGPLSAEGLGIWETAWSEVKAT